MLRQGLHGGFWHAWLVGIGGMTVDFILVFLFYFGLSAYLLDIPYIQTVMWFAGFLFLLYLGIQSIRESTELHAGETHVHVKKPSLFKAFGSGFTIALTPGYVMFWLGILGTLLASSLSDVQGSRSFLLVAGGIVTGILIHDILFSWIVSYSRRLLKPKAIRWISIGAGVILTGFGFYFGYEFIRELTGYFYIKQPD
ncbi:LysE family transporter [Bacillus sp. H-16]|uniref:LysE family translocator n=1 Tax=Alteribacter salitolerans TaxID=2912333 RepID=UPI001965D6B6|nr:LysE family transporter [Alteribacter salitolerans]MBM7094751.1 LysE family transporter [Alteribacter salitolerans]